MKQWTHFIVFFLFTIYNALLTTALPYRHLVVFEPDISFDPHETIVAAQLHVSPKEDGTGDYLLKEVPLISRNINKEIISIDETHAEEVKMPQNVATQTDVMTPAEAAAAAASKSVNDDEELIQKNDDESSKSVNSLMTKPQINKYSPVDSGKPIYITIPIYVNSAAPGMPLTLSVDNQHIQLTSKRMNIAGRRGSLQSEESPTSLYNKLLESTLKENK